MKRKMEVEEISYKYYLGLVLVVKRKVDCDAKLLGLFNTPEKDKEEREQYGRTIIEINNMIKRALSEELRIEQLNMPLSQQIKVKIEVGRTLYNFCENPSIIHPLLLSKLFQTLDVRLEECDEELENIVISFINEPAKRIVLVNLVKEYIQFLNFAKKKITNFYLHQPYRTLELSDSLSEKLLTVDVCLSPIFLPYITGNLKTPKWMVPRTVRTINDARRIHQTCEYIKEEGMNIFVQLAKSSILSFDLWKMVAAYAVDLSKLRFTFCDVITEEMLRYGQFDHLIRARYLADISPIRAVIIV